MGKEKKNAFQGIKEAFTSEPVLAIPNLDKKNKGRSRCVKLCNRRSVMRSLRRK